MPNVVRPPCRSYPHFRLWPISAAASPPDHGGFPTCNRRPVAKLSHISHRLASALNSRLARRRQKPAVQRCSRAPCLGWPATPNRYGCPPLARVGALGHAGTRRNGPRPCQCRAGTGRDRRPRAMRWKKARPCARPRHRPQAGGERPVMPITRIRRNGSGDRGSALLVRRYGTRRYPLSPAP
jgi:hypothetical protein